jgi:hypothetical protein
MIECYRQIVSLTLATLHQQWHLMICPIGTSKCIRVIEAQMLATPDQQISLTDPDARSMATSGRGSGVVGYNV